MQVSRRPGKDEDAKSDPATPTIITQTIGDSGDAPAGTGEGRGDGQGHCFGDAEHGGGRAGDMPGSAAASALAFP